MEQLIEAATAEAVAVRTITRADGTTYQGCTNYGTAVDGALQVYVVPVTQRTRAMQEHYRATFYVLRDGAWKRTSRAAFTQQIEGGRA